MFACSAYSSSSYFILLSRTHSLTLTHTHTHYLSLFLLIYTFAMPSFSLMLLCPSTARRCTSLHHSPHQFACLPHFSFDALLRVRCTSFHHSPREARLSVRIIPRFVMCKIKTISIHIANRVTLIYTMRIPFELFACFILSVSC